VSVSTEMSEFGTLITAPGVQVWRINNFQPLAVDTNEVGCFFEGDAYIVLSAKKAPSSSTLNYDIFFWLGSKCSQDESGAAALKTIELDDALGGAPVQHRETQGNESAGFMGVFPAFQVLAGEASKSGFRKVDGSPPAPRLLQVKGKVTPRMTEVPMSAASLNSGDCFILDANQTIFVWNGQAANKNEKAKAIELAQLLRGNSLHAKLGAVVVGPLNQGSETAEFWAALGGQGAIAAAVPDADEPAPEPKKLWFLANEGADFQEIASGQLHRAALDPDNIYVASDGHSRWFVWKGPGASKEEKRNCMRTINSALQSRGLPIQTEIVNCGQEPASFKNCFVNWAKSTPHPKLAVAAPQEESAADVVKTMKKRQSAVEKNWDDGTGTKKVYRVDCSTKGQFGVKEIPASGHFFGGDTYIIEYIYNAGKSILLYLWQGINSTQDERGTGAFELVRMDDKHGGRAVQVVVLQGKRLAIVDF
jgi:gelsolin